MLPAQAIATIRGVTLEAAEADLREADVVPTERPSHGLPLPNYLTRT